MLIGKDTSLGPQARSPGETPFSPSVSWLAIETGSAPIVSCGRRSRRMHVIPLVDEHTKCSFDKGGSISYKRTILNQSSMSNIQKKGMGWAAKCCQIGTCQQENSAEGKEWYDYSRIKLGGVETPQELLCTPSPLNH